MKEFRPDTHDPLGRRPTLRVVQEAGLAGASTSNSVQNGVCTDDDHYRKQKADDKASILRAKPGQEQVQEEATEIANRRCPKRDHPWHVASRLRHVASTQDEYTKPYDGGSNVNPNEAR